MVIDFQVLADDVDITSKIKALGSYSINITDNIGDNSDTLAMRLADANDNLAFPTTTAKLEVHIGYKENLKSFGFFYITDTKYNFSKAQGSFIDIVASSVPFVETSTYKSMQTSQERSFNDTTVDAVISEIAQEHNLEPVINTDIGSKVITNESQHNESNIGFLYRLVRKYGGVLKPTHSKLLVLDNTKGTNVSGEELEPIELRLDQLNNISYTSKKTAQYRSVQASYHDTSTGITKSVTVGSGEPVNKLSHMYPNQQEALDMAKKLFKSSTLDNDSMSLSTIGDPDLIAGAPIEIVGLRDDIPQEWRIDSAGHSISKSGYSTSLNLTVTSFTNDADISADTSDDTSSGIDETQDNEQTHNQETTDATVYTNLTVAEKQTLNEVIDIVNDWAEYLEKYIDDI